MFPTYFKSQVIFDQYINCINKIEIGDTVECMLTATGHFARPSSLKLIKIEDAAGWPHKIILPVIGTQIFRDEDRQYGQKKHTVVGVEEKLAHSTGAYRAAQSHYDNYNISFKRKGRFIYHNGSLDMVFSRIIKKNNNVK